jgi:hypothetical protein
VLRFLTLESKLCRNVRKLITLAFFNKSALDVTVKALHVFSILPAAE